MRAAKDIPRGVHVTTSTDAINLKWQHRPQIMAELKKNRYIIVRGPGWKPVGRGKRPIEDCYNIRPLLRELSFEVITAEEY